MRPEEKIFLAQKLIVVPRVDLCQRVVPVAIILVHCVYVPS